MPTPKLPDALAVAALNLVEEWGSGHLAIKAGAVAGLDARTIDKRAETGRLRGLTPTFRKEAKRIYTPSRLGRQHCVIPDVQSKPGVRNDHMEWVGNFIAEKKPDVIVMIGDFWDMPSLSSFDKGRKDFEGRRYVNDVKAGRIAMEKLLTPVRAVKGYAPEMHFCLGNHEIRIVRFADDSPEWTGKVDLDDLGIKEYGWQMHDFLKVVEIDGIEYSHYFTSGTMGRPVSSARALMGRRNQSATMGHVQDYDVFLHKTQQRTMFCGTCYLHDEKYLGPQGNSQRRQIVMKHEVEDGRYDLMEVSLKFLGENYA